VVFSPSGPNGLIPTVFTTKLPIIFRWTAPHSAVSPFFAVGNRNIQRPLTVRKVNTLFRRRRTHCDGLFSMITPIEQRQKNRSAVRVVKSANGRTVWTQRRKYHSAFRAQLTVIYGVVPII